MLCPSCNTELPAQANFCLMCGLPLRQAATGPTQRLVPNDTQLRSMRQGRCPQCGASTVFTDAEVDNYVKFRVSSVAISRFMQAVVSHYICTSCGYIESYLSDADDIATVQTHWTQIDPDT